jgi:4-methyl-5(b-hydroxyethyl)-thiazole monophosphate biosynthesis
VLLYPGAVSFEVMLAVELLGSVEVATSNDAAHIDASGLTISPTVTLARAITGGHQTVLVPGGNPDTIAGDHRIHELLANAAARSAIIGGICAGVVVLADAGLLTGRRITHNYGPATAPPEVVAATEHLWSDTTVLDQPVVVDEQAEAATIITANPWAYVDFATTVGRLAGCFDQMGADSRSRYYRGVR